MFNRLTNHAISVTVLLLTQTAASAATLETSHQPPGVNVVVNSPADSYFTLQSSTNFLNWIVEDMELGGYPKRFYRVPSPENSFRFYRTEERPTNDPGDADGDGIDDVFELEHHTALDPLLSDVGRDSDGDGDINLVEYLSHTDPGDPLNGTLPLRWSLVNPYGIQVDSGADAWHAGRVNDVLPLASGAVLAASDMGGVWLISSAGSAVCLSDDWNQPDILSLAQGPDGAAHVFAGGVKSGYLGLYETDASQPFPLFNWLKVLGPSGGPGVIYHVLAVPSLRRLILSTDDGVWWSPIPAPGTGISEDGFRVGYDWKRALGLPGRQGAAYPTYRGLALGPNDTIVTTGHQSQLNPQVAGIWRGTWGGGDLNFRAATISGVSVTEMYRTELASGASDRSRMYASASSADGKVLAVLASYDGGLNWANANVGGGGVSIGENVVSLGSAAGQQGNSRNNCIAVSPANPNQVALGWVKGPFVSQDSGWNWSQRSQGPHVHADQAAVVFDPYDPTGQRMFVASDGGIIVTTNKGVTWASTFNRNLPNLQFLGSHPVRQFLGSMSVASFNGLLLVGGLQDNGQAFTFLDDQTRPWTRFRGGDGGGDLLLPSGVNLSFLTGGNDANIARHQWNGAQMVSNGYVPLVPAPATQPNAAPAGPMAMVDAPAYANAQGETMIAVLGDRGSLYGLFQGQGGANLHWQPVGSISLSNGQYITAVGSYDGHTILAGTVGGRIFEVPTSIFPPVERTLVFPYWHDAPNAGIGQIVFMGPGTVFVNYFSVGKGALYRSTDAGANWTPLERGLPYYEPIYGMAVDMAAAPNTLYVAQDDRVYASFDVGQTWRGAWAGLPRRPHCADLRLVTDDRTQKRKLLLSTFGRSVWSADLADYARYPLPQSGTAFSGNALQSTYGTAGDFDMLVGRKGLVIHYRRQNDLPGTPWTVAGCLGPRPSAYGEGFFIPESRPQSAAVMQSRIAQAGYAGPLEAVAVMRDSIDPEGANQWLAHYYYDAVTLKWHGPYEIRADGARISHVEGDPALIQSTYGSTGNYEMLVTASGRVKHFWRDNDGGYVWHHRGDLPAPATGGGSLFSAPSGVCLVQSAFASVQGTLEAIVRYTPPLNPTNGWLGYYYRDNSTLQWAGPFALRADGQEIRGVTGDPAFFQGPYGTEGNFELVVPRGNGISRYWRDNSASGYPWHFAGNLPNRTFSGGGVFSPGFEPLSVAYFPSSLVPLQLVVMARQRQVLTGAEIVSQYILNTADFSWSGPQTVLENGRVVDGVTGF